MHHLVLFWWHESRSLTTFDYMKAFAYYQYGGLEVFQEEERAIPLPKKNEIQIQTRATSVTRTDTTMLGADYAIMRLYLGLSKPKKNIIGSQFSGVVTALGDQVTQFKVGDRVFGFEDEGLGCYAEYFTIQENKNIMRMPDDLSFMQAANALEGFHYARNTLNKIDFKARAKILVNGATGGIGTALLKLLQHQDVIVHTTSRPEHFELMRALGSKKCFDYIAENYWESGEQYDFVLDSVGKSEFSQAKQVLRKKGIYISSELGPRGENLWRSLFGFLHFGKKIKFPWPLGLKKSMQVFLQDGHYEAHIEREYPFAELKEAMAYVMSAQKIGNVGIRF